MNGRKNFSRWIALTLAGMLVASCGDGLDPAPQSQTPESSRLPVVLQSDVSVTAAADGSNVREAPVADFDLVTDPTVSPDGSLRLVAEHGELRIESIDGGDAAVLDGVRVATDAPLNVVWSPTGERALFDIASEGEATLYVVKADGSGLQNVADELTGDAFPLAWSDDGSKLAFGLFGTDPASLASTLYVTNAEGSVRVEAGRFLHPQGDAGWDRPRFSPDGSRIVAFAPLTPLTLRVFDPGGGEPRDLGIDGVTKFSWSPDGSSLAFDRVDAQTQRATIWTWDVEGIAARPVTEGRWPRWSPSGERIAIRRDAGDGIESQMYTVRPDGSDETAIANPARYAFHDVRWSEGGSELTFVRPAFSAAQLYRVDLAAGVAGEVGAAMGEAGNPPRSVLLSPDASRVAFVADAFQPGGAWLAMELASGATTTLARGGFPFGDVHWTDAGPLLALGGASASILEPGASEPRPLGTGNVHRVVFSPDGSKLAVLLAETLLIASVEGPDRQVLYKGEAPRDIVQQVDWAPDGAHLTFTVTHDEGGATSLTSHMAGLDGNVTEIVANAGYEGLAYWSPDGNTLAQVRKSSLTDAYDVWLLDAEARNPRPLAAGRRPHCRGAGPQQCRPGRRLDRRRDDGDHHGRRLQRHDRGVVIRRQRAVRVSRLLSRHLTRCQALRRQAPRWSLHLRRAPRTGLCRAGRAARARGDAPLSPPGCAACCSPVRRSCSRARLARPPAAAA